MENALTCTLCSETFNSTDKLPRILKCGHTFCSKCLEALVHSSHLTGSPYINCPYDKSLGHPGLDITEIPINRILIDLIDYSGVNLSSLNISSSSSPLSSSSSSYLQSANNRLMELKDKLTAEYDTLYHLMQSLINEKNQLCKSLTYQYDQIINYFIGEKNKNVIAIEKYIDEKVEKYSLLSKIIDRNRNIAGDGIQKILSLQKQTVKSISIADEISFINQLNLDTIDSKDIHNSLMQIRYEIDNNLLSPKLFIKNEVYANIDQLNNSIRIIYPLNDQSNDGLNNISCLNLQQLNISNNFYWFQPKSSYIYKYQIDTNQWIAIENKSNVEFSEMFRVCQLSPNEVIITGGVDNMLSSKMTIYFNDGLCYTKSDMFTARRAHGTCLLNDEVYVCGGIDSHGQSISQCEKYSLNMQCWKKVGDMPTKRSHVSLCSFNNKGIYSFGGDIDEILVNIIDYYNMQLDQWNQLPICLPYPIECCATHQMTSSDIIIIGGYSTEQNAFKKVMMFNESLYTINTQSLNEISHGGWTVYSPIKIGDSVHLFFGGEDKTVPYHVKYNIVMKV